MESLKNSLNQFVGYGATKYSSLSTSEEQADSKQTNAAENSMVQVPSRKTDRNPTSISQKSTDIDPGSIVQNKFTIPGTGQVLE